MALIQVNYMSKALFRIVPINVILPVDRFDADADRYLMDKDHKYKTLYLLHGLLGNYMRPLSGRNFLKSQEGCSRFLTEGRILLSRVFLWEVMVP